MEWKTIWSNLTRLLLSILSPNLSMTWAGKKLYVHLLVYEVAGGMAMNKSLSAAAMYPVKLILSVFQ